MGIGFDLRYHKGEILAGIVKGLGHPTDFTLTFQGQTLRQVSFSQGIGQLYNLADRSGDRIGSDK
jgi:hypothetical protein